MRYVAPAARAHGAKAASIAAQAGSWPAAFLGVEAKRARAMMAILSHPRALERTLCSSRAVRATEQVDEHPTSK
eukprot:scaffold8474_cov134-Isochrysis_galbana.AAC.2